MTAIALHQIAGVQWYETPVRVRRFETDLSESPISAANMPVGAGSFVDAGDLTADVYKTVHQEQGAGWLHAAMARYESTSGNGFTGICVYLDGHLVVDVIGRIGTQSTLVLPAVGSVEALRAGGSSPMLPFSRSLKVQIKSPIDRTAGSSMTYLVSRTLIAQRVRQPGLLSRLRRSALENVTPIEAQPVARYATLPLPVEGPEAFPQSCAVAPADTWTPAMRMSGRGVVQAAAIRNGSATLRTLTARLVVDGTVIITSPPVAVTGANQLVDVYNGVMNVSSQVAVQGNYPLGFSQYAEVQIKSSTDVTPATPVGVSMRGYWLENGGVGGFEDVPSLRGSATSAQTSETTSHPMALPSGIQAGDLLMCFFSHDGSGSRTPSAGWVLHTAVLDNNTFRTALFVRVATGDANDNLTITTPASEQSCGVVFCCVGKPHVDTRGQATTTAATTGVMNATSFNEAVPLPGLVIAYSTQNGGSTLVSATGDYSGVPINNLSSGSSASASVNAGYLSFFFPTQRVLNSTFTYSTSTTSDRIVAFLTSVGL